VLDKSHRRECFHNHEGMLPYQGCVSSEGFFGDRVSTIDFWRIWRPYKVTLDCIETSGCTTMLTPPKTNLDTPKGWHSRGKGVRYGTSTIEMFERRLLERGQALPF